MKQKKQNLYSKKDKIKHAASLGTMSVIAHCTLHANRETLHKYKLWAYLKKKKKMVQMRQMSIRNWNSSAVLAWVAMLKWLT